MCYFCQVNSLSGLIYSVMIKRECDYSLLHHNTFGVDVKAATFIEFESQYELEEIIKSGIQQPCFVIGGGSNLLFMGDYCGTILHSAIKDIKILEETDSEVLVRVGSGVTLDNFIDYSIQMGWQGLENLSAIPGEVGASAVQNVGAYGVEAGNLIERVEAVGLQDGDLFSFTAEECSFAYRDSFFKKAGKNRYVITYVTYRLRKLPDAKYSLEYGNLRNMVVNAGDVTPQSIREAVKDIRSAKLPDTSVLGSAGSFFMNPVITSQHAASLLKEYPAMPQYDTADGGKKLSAAWLIDRCGWKEKRMGDVGVYCHQPLVIVNHGDATGKEIYNYSQLIADSVKEKFGVDIQREVNIIE